MPWFKRQTDEEKLWSWFLKNRDLLAHKPMPSPRVVIAARKHFLNAYPRLSFEVGIAADGIHEFFVSCDGDKDLIGQVRRAVRDAPAVPGWRIVAFRQPTPEISHIETSGRNVRSDEIYFTAVPTGKRFKVNLYVEGLMPESFNQLGTAVGVLVDAAIGEYAAMTMMSECDLLPLDAADGNQRPLAELGQALGISH